MEQTEQEAARLRRRALLGINLVSFFWGLGLGASIPVIPILSYQFVPDLTLAGLVTAIGGAGGLISSYISGPLTDRFGRRRVTIAGIVIRAIFSFAEGLVPSYAALTLARLGSAVGTGIYGTGMAVITADIATARDRGSVVGGRSTLAQVGNVLGPAVGTALWAWSGDIRVPFIFNGCSKVICLLLFLWIMHETGERVGSSAGRKMGGRVSLGRRLVPAFLSVGLGFVVYAVFLEAMFRQSLNNVILPIYLKEVLQKPQQEVGLIISSTAMGGVVMAYPAGFIADRWGVKTGILLGAALAASSLLYIAITGNANIVTGGALGCGAALFLVSAQAYAVDIAPPGTRGQFFGLTASAGQAAALLGPLIVGRLTDVLGYAFPFFMLGAMTIALLPMAHFMVRQGMVAAEGAPA